MLAKSSNDNVMELGDSSRIVGLVQLLLKSNAASSLIEDYAACLELRSEESQFIENSSDDPGVLILQVSLVNCYWLLPFEASLCFLCFTYFFLNNLAASDRQY